MRVQYDEYNINNVKTDEFIIIINRNHLFQSILPLHQNIHPF